jgi:hypothetical protein
MTAAPVRDNLLFGRIAFGGSSGEQKVRAVGFSRRCNSTR